MVETTKNEMKEALDELRKASETYGENSSKALEMAEKTNEAFEQSEKEHNTKMIEIQGELKSALEVKERVEELELELAKKGNQDGVDYKELDEYKELNDFAKTGIIGKTMRMDTGTSGGYLTTTEMDDVLAKEIKEISPVRQVARVRQTSSKTLEVPKRTTILVATYEGEAAAGGESQSVFANEQLTAHRLTVTVPVTMDLLMDGQFDVEALIRSDALEAFAFGEGNKFVLGDGVKKPEGFTVNPAVVAAQNTSAASGVVDADDLITLAGDLKIGQNPIYGFNRQSLAVFRKEKSSSGGYLFQIGLEDAAPNLINGVPYIILQDMPSIAANSLSVVYADFLRGYLITDRTGMTIIRDEFTNKKNAIVDITFHKWNTGQVILDDAFKLLKTKA